MGKAERRPRGQGRAGRCARVPGAGLCCHLQPSAALGWALGSLGGEDKPQEGVRADGEGKAQGNTTWQRGRGCFSSLRGSRSRVLPRAGGAGGGDQRGECPLRQLLLGSQPCASFPAAVQAHLRENNAPVKGCWESKRCRCRLPAFPPPRLRAGCG